MQNLAEYDDIGQKYFCSLVNKGEGRLKRLQSVQNDNGNLWKDVNEIRNEWNGYYGGLYADYTSQNWDSEFKGKIRNEIDEICKCRPKDETMNGAHITVEETKCMLTHWGRVTHICVGNLTIIGSDNGLSPGGRQAIIWTSAGIMLIGP